MEDWFAIAVYELPAEVNGSNIYTFARFFELYGDHIITKCKRVGGMVTQMVAINNNYFLKHSLEEAGEQARMFMQNDMGSLPYKHDIDKAFMKEAEVQPLKNFGGRYEAGMDGFKNWVSSITHDKKDLACL